MITLEELNKRLEQVESECDKAVSAAEVADTQLRQAEVQRELGDCTEKSLNQARELASGSADDLKELSRRRDAVRQAVAIRKAHDESEASELKMMISTKVKSKADSLYDTALGDASKALGILAGVMSAQRNQAPGMIDPRGLIDLCCRNEQKEVYANSAWGWIADQEKMALKTKSVRAVA